MLRAMIRLGLAAVFVTVLIVPALGQTPQEHEQHHPAAPSTPPPPPAQPEMPNAPTDAGQQGMGAMMGQGMGIPPPQALYPSLMDVPELTPERRAELERLAGERMIAGSALMSAALERLTAATQRGDRAAMQEATAQVREGLAQFESGLATQRAVAEGRAPRDIALEWFRREMNLTPLETAPGAHGLFGLSWFHYISMFILASFAVTTIWMHFHRMRRAEALLTALASAPTHSGPSAAPAPPAAPPADAPPAAPSSSSVAGQPGDRWIGRLRVGGILSETPDVKTFRLVDRGGGPVSFTYEPGQFLTITATIDGKAIKRSYTIASPPTRRDHVEITVKREPFGLMSQFLHDHVREGDELSIAAPGGYFTFTGREADSIVLIGGGVGITPLMSAIRHVTDSQWPGDIFLLYSCKTPADVIFREELEALSRRHANMHVTVTISRGDGAPPAYQRGRLSPLLLSRTIPNLSSQRIHLCGPPAMMEAARQMLQELGVPRGQVKTENFGTATRSPAAVAVRPMPAVAAPVPPRRGSVADIQAPPPAVSVDTAPLPTITFARSRKAMPAPVGATVLDVAELIGVEIDSACRSGTCGTCKVKLTSGGVTMAVEEALEPQDKAQHLILACQAKPTEAVVVEA